MANTKNDKTTPKNAAGTPTTETNSDNKNQDKTLEISAESEPTSAPNNNDNTDQSAKRSGVDSPAKGAGDGGEGTDAPDKTDEPIISDNDSGTKDGERRAGIAADLFVRTHYNVIYFTSDCTPFGKLQDARRHAGGLSVKTIYKAER